MKKILISIAALLVIVSCNSGTSYKINGTITGNSDKLASGIVYLSNNDKQDPIKDSTQIVNGKFTFTGFVQTPEKYWITVPGLSNGIVLFLENANYTVNAVDSALIDASVTGGENNERWLRHNAAKNEIIEKYDVSRLYAEFKNPEITEERQNELYAIFDTVQIKTKELNDKIFNEAPVSHYSLYLLSGFAEELSIDSLGNLIGEYQKKPEYKGNKVLARIVANYEIEKSLQVGQPCIDFTIKDIDRKDLTFSDVYPKNKITMIDFWAGWCSPCRQFNPVLVEIYKQYHEKGFEVVGVSMDVSEDQWRDAIKEDKLPWIQTSNIKYWKCPVGQSYNVHYIPQNIFVNSEGTIVARRLGEEEIKTFLEENLK